MASRAVKTAFGGSHTAGIFADMTVDGPEIGTLVVIVDRAKNLPNRKTMGKQDPYCAARLGKEAKKTETDKRGGQTPRWDQEMRFTVHDSPDYYQLKVSVFNDDKKTELIGETWVALEDIIIPGGGQNDRWHHLNCKGRFAGEIRIEITYYDTRPKEEKMEERRKESSFNGHNEQARDGISGPRQPKPIKRRPLPADPTGSVDTHPIMPDHPHSSSTLSTPSKTQYVSNTQPKHIDQPVDYRLNTTPPSNLRYQHPHDQDRGSPMTYNTNGQELYNDYTNVAPSARRGVSPQHEMYDPPRKEIWLANPAGWHQGTQEQHESGNSSAYEEDIASNTSPAQDPYHDYHQRDDLRTQRSESLHSRPPLQPLQDPLIDPQLQPLLLQPHSMPDVRLHPIHDTFGNQGHRYSLPNDKVFETPPRHHSLGTHRDTWSSPMQASLDDESPPPPPTHRSSGLRSPPQKNERGNLDQYPPITAPAPLNIRTHRASTSASPLSQVQSNVSHMEYPLSASPTSQDQGVSQYGYPPSTSPSNSYQLSRSGASFSSHASYSQPSRKQSQNALAQSPTKDYGHALPPSLVPGYEPSIAEDESQRLLQERQTSNQLTHVHEPASQYQALTLHNSQPEQTPQYQVRSTHEPQLEQNPQHQSLPMRKPHPQTYPKTARENQTPIRYQEISQVRSTPQSSSSSTKPRATSPDSRTPTRKSVSPAPQTSTEKRAPAIPFSPDSYDSFNPDINTASSINSRGPKYNTPEQAREALYEFQKEARLSEGPIIGSDGRVIDPSDHLPTDTWAPEPETKKPRKGPEVTLRFRHSPQGAQPMPLGARRPPRETTARSHTVSTPVVTNSPDANSPGSFGDRSRLQKYHISSGQPNSSPAVPTIHTARSRGSMPRASVSDYPTREHGNYSYDSGSPYSRGLSNGGIPPPVPGKIPISAGRAEEDWDHSALSEEMRRIDIGVGGGQPRSRRNRLGM